MGDNTNALSLFIAARKEYQTILVNTLKPIIYDLFRDMYSQSKIKAQESIFVQKKLSVIEIFQMYLLTVKDWSNDAVLKYANFIYASSSYGETLKTIIKVTVKIKIIIMTISTETDEDFHKKYIDNFDINAFFHRCYIECAKDCHNYATYFKDDDITIERYKMNENQIENFIENGIIRAIDQSIPIEQIGQEFLKKNFATKITQPPPPIPQAVAPIIPVPPPAIQMMVPEHLLNPPPQPQNFGVPAPAAPAAPAAPEPVNVNINVNPPPPRQRRPPGANNPLADDVNRLGRMVQSAKQFTEKNNGNAAIVLGKSERSKTDNPFGNPKRYLEVYGATPRPNED